MIHFYSRRLFCIWGNSRVHLQHPRDLSVDCQVSGEETGGSSKGGGVTVGGVGGVVSV